METQLWQQQFQLARKPHTKFLYWREWRTLSRAELRYAQRADCVLTVSAQNWAYFSRYVSPPRVATIAAGVDGDSCSPTPDSDLPLGMVFTAFMDWMPNRQVMLFFTSETLQYASAEPPARSSKNNSDGGGRVTGRHDPAKSRARIGG